ncbi:MAG: alpha/beta hydrolase [Actinomycetota bacterium]
MHVKVNGVRLYFDVEGAQLVPSGASMRAKPTLLLLHGGPGFDHSVYKPAFSQLADIAQVVYLDHRGNGRSDRSSPEFWTLAQWGDDVAAFCRALGIESPIIYGASFGGMVAVSYATRHPSHPGKLILVSTEARGYSHLDRRVELFERLGGSEIGDLARRRFLEGATDPETLDQWLRLAVPLYTRNSMPLDAISRAVRNPDVTAAFTRPGGEQRTFDLTPDLANVECPVLVLGGEDDPMVPIEAQHDLVDALPESLVRFESFPNAGHGVISDAPEAAMSTIRDFITAGL